MRRPCGVSVWVPGQQVTSAPYVPEDEEPVRDPVTPGEPVEVAPAQPWAAGESWHVGIGRFPFGGFRGWLWRARIEQAPVPDRRVGPNRLTISAPTDPVTMRLIGDVIPGAFTQSGDGVYHVSKAVSFELFLASTIDGKTRRRFVVRDQVEIRNGRITMTGVGWVGGLTADRVIGAPTRRNLIGRRRGSFTAATLDGWRLIGPGDAGVEPGGPDGGYSAWVTGVPGSTYLETRVRYSQPVRPWGRQRIAGQAYVRLPPASLDIEDFGLVTIAVVEGGQLVWPDPRRGDPEAGVVTSDMARNSWHSEPVVGVGYLPTPPFSCDVWLRLHAVDEVQKVRFTGGSIFRRENTSTVDPVDLIRHPGQLLRHAQAGRDKSDWGVGHVLGDPTGIVEVGTWWHQDGQRLDDAFEELAGQGLEIFDLAGPGRRVKTSRRRGRVRTDIVLWPWDVLGEVSWRVDPGAQRTAARGISAAGSLWGGADEGAIDTSQADGQVIDVTLQGPVGMTPTRLRRWLVDQLGTLSLLQATSTRILPLRLAQRLAVGDSLRVWTRSGSAGHFDWWRITQIAPEYSRKFAAVQFGTDPDLGGRT